MEGTKIGCFGAMNQVHIQPFLGQKRQKASGLAEEHRTFLLLHLYSVIDWDRDVRSLKKVWIKVKDAAPNVF